MSKFITKVVTGVSTVAMATMMMVLPVATTHAATAGEVYKTTDGTVWFITKDMHRRPFTSGGAFMSYGFLSFSQVKDADSTVTGLPTGDFIAPQDGRIFCATETKGSDVKGECSLITGGNKAAFTSASVFTGQGYSFGRAFYGDSSFLSKTSNVDNASAQHRAGTLINNGGTVQLIVSGGLWGVPSMDVFNSWGWSFSDVVPANSADKLLSQTGIIPARMAGDLVPTASAPIDNGGDNGDLNGTVGDITVSSSSLYSNESIGEGETDKGVMAFKIKAGNDSDVRINSVKVKLWQSNSGDSKDINKYIDEVTVWNGDNQVGSADPSDFNEDSHVYTKSVALSGADAIVKAGTTATFSVKVSAKDSLDSGNIDTDAWHADVLNVRFTDGDGVTTTTDTSGLSLARAFDFETFATAADVELRATLNDEEKATNDSHNILVDDTNSTNDVPVLAFNLEARGDSDIHIKSIPVTLTTSDSDITSVATTADLYMGSEKIASDDVNTASTSDQVVFDDLDIDINSHDTQDFTVKLNFIKSTGHYIQGTTIQATLDVTSIDAQDQNGNDVASADLTGSAISTASSLFSNGITVDVDSADATVSTQDGATNDLATFTWDITVKNIGNDDVYVNSDNVDVVSSSATDDVDDIYAIQQSGSNALTALSGTIANTGSTNSITVAADATAYQGVYSGENFFKLTPGQTKTFRITVTGTNSTAAGQVRAYLSGIEWTTDDITAATSKDSATRTINTFNASQFQTDSQTPYVAIN